MSGSPAAHPRSVVLCAHARFTVLTPRLIRLEWSPSAQFEDRGTYAFPTRYAEPVKFTSARHGNKLEIDTGALTLRYTDDGDAFNPRNLSIQFTLNGQTVTWTPGKVNVTNLRGTRRTVDQCAGAAPLEEGLVSRQGWSLYDDSRKPVWDKNGAWIELRLNDPSLDWYFFGYGHDYAAALREYTAFGGRAPLVPRYVLGSWWSRYWAYTEADLKQIVNDFTDHDLPLDVLVIDMDWHTPFAWTGYTWNRDLFPDPAAFLDWVHQRGLYATLNLHPAQGVQKHEEIYPQFAALLGHDTASGDAVKFSPADKAFMQHYFEQLHHPMEAQGVDFWWLDWQQEEVDGLDPLAWLNHLHFRDSARRGQRPMLYSRWGGLGNHRYPIGFSGDAFGTWEALRFQAYFTAAAANVGYGWWSHDIGGHFWATQPELYARWVQFGAVSPCLRLHSTKDPLAERRPWAFPQPVFEAAREAFHLRYRLLPYLYSAARAATQVGQSLSMPMYYANPEADDAYIAREQYMLGDQLLAAPVVQPADPATGTAPVDVWLPPGTWIDYATLESYAGPRWVRVNADLNRIPMFVKAGAILPMAPKIMRTRDFDGSNLIVTVFPGADGAFDLYEDDGVTEGYLRGDYEITPLRTHLSDDDTLEIEIGAAQGNCLALPRTRSIEVRARGVRPPQRVTVDGAETADWRYDEAAREVIVMLPPGDRSAARHVVVHGENLRSVVAISEAKPEAPLYFHAFDYTVYEDARQQLGAVVIAPPAARTTKGFDAVVRWEKLTASRIDTETVTLENCTQRQIAYCPFADEGDLRPFRWRVTVEAAGQRFEYASQTAYPAINRWATQVYDISQPPADSETWTLVEQTASDNLRQPYGLNLLPWRRERAAIESLEGRARTVIRSGMAQKAVLHVQSVGTVTAYLNGVELQAAAPVPDPANMPMFFTWMPTTQHYFRLPLAEGENTLLLVTRPEQASGWWGVGATVLDKSGEILLLETTP
jgi:alpha-glucosidase